MIKIFRGDSQELFCDVRKKALEVGGPVIVVSDPPFNIGYGYKSYKDRMKEDEYYEMLAYFFEDQPSVVIHYPEQLYRLAFQIGKFPEEVCSWVYNSNNAKQHRDIVFFDCKPDFGQVRQPYKDMKDPRNIERMKSGRATGAKIYDWWNVNQVKNKSPNKTPHPCQMPLEVMTNLIGILPYDAVIIDPFMGSGTTGMAVVKMNQKQPEANRSFFGIELDPEYFAIAKQRIEHIQKTGEEPLLNK